MALGARCYKSGRQSAIAASYSVWLRSLVNDDGSKLPCCCDARDETCIGFIEDNRSIMVPCIDCQI